MTWQEARFSAKFAIDVVPLAGLRFAQRVNVLRWLTSPKAATRNLAVPVDVANRKRCLMPRGFSADRHERRLREAAERREVAHYEMARTAPIEDGLCYFVGFEDGDGLVKIGHSLHLRQRLRRLQSTSPFKLKLLATCRGGREAEMHYHRKFAAHAKGGEWFARCPEIEAEIARLEDSCRRAAA